jgi:hypothetical protein
VDASLGTIWEAVVGRLPDAVAISEPGRDDTYAEFEQNFAKLAAALENAGVGVLRHRREPRGCVGTAPASQRSLLLRAAKPDRR